MAKKKLKLKKMKDIKESVIKENKKKPIKKKVKTKKKHIGNIIGITLITLGIAFLSVCIAFGLYIVFTSPEFTQEKLYTSESTNIFWKDGSLMAKVGEENRVNKNYEDLPQVLVDALVATEDARFFQHSGFDAARFVKASFGQLLGHSDAGGASTLSMQLSKNFFTGLESRGLKGIIRKFQDIYMAVFKIENNYTKEQIIEMYLNILWFAGGGTNIGGTYGVEQASQYYFGKSVVNLSLPEAAMLVGMINNASYYNPYENPEDVNDRKDTVLSLMHRHGYISEEEMLDAQKIDIRSLIVTSGASSNEFQSLVDYVKNEIKDKYKIDIYRDGGFDVYTTFDKNVQGVINNMQNGAAYQFRDELMQVATAITSVTDGSISGLGAGRNYVAMGLNRAAKGFNRQPGSTAKPLVDYGPLIEYENASTGQMFIDFRYTYNNGSNMNNWDNSYKGVMTMKNGLSQSRNVTALEAFHQNKTENIKTFLNNLGIDEDNYGDKGIFESFSIGGWPKGLAPLESSAAYAAFARGGYYIEPYSFTKIVNRETEETIEFKYEKKRAMSEETAYMITDILLQATSEGVGGSINRNLRGTIASKSGTSNIDSESAKQLGVSVYATPDHWVNTYNNEYAISMWMGYDTLDSNHYFTTPTGSGPRGKISAYLANNVLTKNEKFEKPSGVVSVTVESNLLPMKRASEYTPGNMKYSALFKQGTEPSETSTRFSKLDNPKNGTSSVKDKTISLSWNEASSPKTLDSNAVRTELANYFKSYKKSYSYSYQLFETKYMKIYDNYTTSAIGSFGYQIYLKDNNGNLTSLGWTQSASYNYVAPASGEYTFVIKSAYSIFKNNQADGLEIKATVKATDPPIETGLSATASPICLEKNGTLNPKKALKITFNGEDVTAKAVVTTSTLDTSTIGEKTVTYSITYQEKQIQITGKVKIAETCSSEED